MYLIPAGRGNAAFEVADHIYGSTNLIHMFGRSRVRLSWSTHYVGDLRLGCTNILHPLGGRKIPQLGDDNPQFFMFFNVF